MFNKLFGWIFGHTVDSLIADLVAKVERLEGLVAKHATDARKHEDKAEELREKASAARNEGLRASNIAFRLKTLVS